MNLSVVSDPLAINTLHYIVLEEINLPDELKETSALYWPELGSAFTLNDSGNKTIIYNIDASGQIINKRRIVAKNTDWEVLTGDSQHFYIGDVGNNNGKRKFIQNHIVPKQDSNSKTNVTTS